MAAGSASAYMRDAGSAPGRADILDTNVGGARSIGGPVPPGTYSVRRPLMTLAVTSCAIASTDPLARPM